MRTVTPLRSVLALVAAGAAVFSLADSFAAVVARVSPDVAHRLAPWDGKIAAELAQKEFSLAAARITDLDAETLARDALRKEPTAVEALSVLGLEAQLRNETEVTRQIFSHSLALTRRELPPRLWSIEEAVSRGDVDEALLNYDIALRTSNRASVQLFPVLASALREPEIRAKLIAILAKEPVWREGFISHAAREGGNPVATAAFFREARRRGLPIDEEMETALVNTFVDHGRIAEAWQYYSTIRPGVARDQSRDPNFTFTGARRALFDWSVSEYGSIQASEDAGVLAFTLPPTVGGAIATQAQHLPAGKYRITGRSEGIEQEPASLPYWTLKCGETELGRVTIPNSAENGGRFSGTVSVPGSCPLQSLVLMARATSRFDGVTGQILHVQLEPAR